MTGAQTRYEMSSRAEAFEGWIRTSFVQMNTELENLYFAMPDRNAVITAIAFARAAGGSVALDVTLTRLGETPE